MLPIDDMEYSPVSEKLTEALCVKTQNHNKTFFRLLVAYTFCKVAATMRVSINSAERGGLIPVNAYCINLAPSGFGKTYSMNIIEDNVISGFMKTFKSSTLPYIAEMSLSELASSRSVIKGTSEEDELVRVTKEFESLGELAFSFDSATSPAIKQMRHKLLMLKAGAVNMEIDEIGANLEGNLEALGTLLELYDVGKVKAKLTKNTNESVRSAEIEGKTPTNAMLFGTPAKLLNGSKTEDIFNSQQEQGYARRSLYGYAIGGVVRDNLTPSQIYDALTDTSLMQDVEDIANHITDLASVEYFETELTLTRPNEEFIIEYRLWCEERADAMPDHKEIAKAEMAHRYFKMLKLAGAYAFIETSTNIEKCHLEYAIKLVEVDSGNSFTNLINRDRNYVKLAKYLASMDREVTHVDLLEDLVFYKGSETARRELMALAITYGYNNNIIVKRRILDGIEFISGSSLVETDLDALELSYSANDAIGFDAGTLPFSMLHELTQDSTLKFSNHTYLKKHRKTENTIEGCNFIVLDIDGTADIGLAQILLEEYYFHLYTTKSHTEESHRFRLILPLSHKVELGAEEFKEFMGNIYAWLPIEVDELPNDRTRRWSSNQGKYLYNEGKLLDVFQFIPNTSKCNETILSMESLGNLSSVERWFVQDTKEGQRNNKLLRYALMLVDTNHYDYDTIVNMVMALNGKLAKPIEETELMLTVMKTVGQKIAERSKGVT